MPSPSAAPEGALAFIKYLRETMVPPRIGEVLAERTRSPILWLEEGSHFAHVDAVQRFLPPVLEFLAA